MNPEWKPTQATPHRAVESGTNAGTRDDPTSENQTYSFNLLLPASPNSTNATVESKIKSWSQKNGSKTPILPKLKTPSFSSHQNAANPALAVSLLQEIQAIATGWQTQLQDIVRQIQDLYLEGPIVDGWLESNAQQTPGKSPTPERLAEAKPGDLHPHPGYRLCGLEENGKMWSRPCPPDQVASVSVAIARYQKLRQLLNRKQDLETRLVRLAETLVILHGHLRQNEV